MTDRTRGSWLVYALGALCAGAVAAAVLVVGPASSSQATVTRTAAVAQGVVQSTVSGSGNLQALSQLNLGFKTGGTVTHIYVTQGQQVTQGELLASLDPQSAEVTLEQAKASLQSAEANLAKEEETDGETSTGSGTGGASAASYHGEATSQIADAAYSVPTNTTTAPASTTPATTTPTNTTPSTTTPSATTPTATTPTSTTPSTTSPTSRTRTTTTPASTSPSSGATSERETKSKESSSGSSTTKATISTATREANLASARAAVKSDTLTVHSDEQAVQDTNLYAPESGTIVSLSGQVGEVVSGSGTTRASSSSSSSSGSGASGAGATGASGRSATGASSSSSSSAASSSSSSAFAVLSDLSTMQLVVPLSESEIGNVKVGQIATVTVEALSATKLAAHVSEVALLSSSSSGAVSYDVTFQLDQLAPGLRLGMSATAEVVVKQAEGINVPTSAITADSVTVERAGKQVRQRVVTGLAGNTSTIILSGLKAGETVVLPAASTTSSSTSLTSRISSRLGGGGLGGAALGGGGLGGGGAAFFRGGG
ncbi:MAG: efflux RND transporter periplasmic adaptor subunit [Solirubrobacteraceae bacterium]